MHFSIAFSLTAGATVILLCGGYFMRKRSFLFVSHAADIPAVAFSTNNKYIMVDVQHWAEIFHPTAYAPVRIAREKPSTLTQR